MHAYMYSPIFPVDIPPAPRKPLRLPFLQEVLLDLPTAASLSVFIPQFPPLPRVVGHLCLWLPRKEKTEPGLYSCLRTRHPELRNLPTTLKFIVSLSLTLPKSKQGRDPPHFTNEEVSLQEEWCQPGPGHTSLIKKFCFLDLTLQCRFHANAGQ